MAIKLRDDQREELKVSLDRHFNYAQGYVDIAVKGYARDAWEYYYGNLPLPVTTGASKYVDRTVWETVNGTLQDVLNVFVSGEDAVRFCATDENDAEAAYAATRLVNQIVLRDNLGYNVLSSALKECLVTRNSFIKRYWDEETSTKTEEVEGVDPQAFAAYIQGLEDAGIKNIEADAEEQEDGTVNATVTYTQTVKRVKIEYVPSEQVFVDEHATTFEDATYFCHRTRKSKQDLLELGFPEDELESFNDWSDPMDSTQTTVAWSRTDWRQDIDQDIGTTVDDLASMAWVYEHYIRTSLIGPQSKRKRQAKLYQVIQAGSHILSVEEVTEIPFVTFSPYPIPGSFYGESIYDITKDIQDLRTALIRGYIDNVNNANYGRYTAVKGAYDRRSLLDNRPGGVVEMDRPDAVNLFPYHNLPNGIDGLISMTEELKEVRTGVTKLGMGINPDVFKNDNAYATVGLMMNAAQNRIRMVCRNIANNGMMDLMRGVYQLVRENGEVPIQIQTSQGIQQINPKQLPPRTHLTVNVAISPAEKNERAQKLLSLKQVLSPQVSPELAPVFNLPQSRFLMAQVFDLMDIKDVHNYLMPLEQVQPPQPSQMDILSQQMAEAQVEYQHAQTQKIMHEAQVEQERLTFEQQKAADDTQGKNLELQFKQEHAADEMSLANRHEDNQAMFEQAKHNLAQMQHQVKQYEATLKELEINLGAQIESHKLVHTANHANADLELRHRAQTATEDMQRQTIKDSKIKKTSGTKA